MVTDGLETLDGWSELVERIKRMIRKLRMSQKCREMFSKLQEELDMPEQVLVKVLAV